MSILETIRSMKQNRNYTIDEVDEIADKMEEEIGAAEMWNTLRPGMELDELIENLEYIARENDL